jgi:hypothetical protein
MKRIGDGEVIPLPPHGRVPAVISNDAGCVCMWCRAPTAWEVLSRNGARCNRCYEAYQTEPRTFPDVGDSKTDPRGWAKALKARDEAGDRLTDAQRDMYRAALRREVGR